MNEKNMDGWDSRTVGWLVVGLVVVLGLLLVALTLHFPAAAPLANFTMSPNTGDPPLVVKFTDTSEGQINDYLWMFGDGGISTEKNPVHVYNSVGIHRVMLVVEGPGGESFARSESGVFVSGTPEVGIDVYGSLSGWALDIKSNNENEKTDAVTLAVTANCNWQVEAKDDMRYGKPADSAGHLTEFDGDAFVPDGSMLSNPLKLSLDGGPFIALSNVSQKLKSGWANSATQELDLGLRQNVTYDDRILPADRVYEIFVSLTASAA